MGMDRGVSGMGGAFPLAFKYCKQKTGVHASCTDLQAKNVPHMRHN